MADEQLDPKEVKEQEQPKETPEDAAQAAAQAAKEKEAARALMETENESGTENEVSVMEQTEIGPELGRKYAELIPEADKQITTGKQVDTLMSLLKNSSGSRLGDLFSTGDKLGNVPGNMYGELMSKSPNRENIADEFDSFGVISKAFAETDENGDFQRLGEEEVSRFDAISKFGSVSKSELPQSIKEALLKINLFEGDNSVVKSYQDLARIIREPSDEHVMSQITKYRDERLPAMKENDKRRAATVKEFVSTLYPDLVNAKAMNFLSLSFENSGSGKMGEYIAKEIGVDPNNLTAEQVKRYYMDNFGEIDTAGLSSGMVKDMDRGSRDAISILERVAQNQLKRELGIE